MWSATPTRALISAYIAFARFSFAFALLHCACAVQFALAQFNLRLRSSICACAFAFALADICICACVSCAPAFALTLSATVLLQKSLGRGYSRSGELLSDVSCLATKTVFQGKNRVYSPVFYGLISSHRGFFPFTSKH